MPRTPKTKTEPELNGMPPADPIAQVARCYLTHRGEVQTAKEAMDVAAGELVAMMKEKKKTKLVIDGQIIERKHTDAKDALKITVPKTTAA